jgi:hypothetical protein
LLFAVSFCFCSAAAQVDAVFASLDSAQIALRVSSMLLAGGDEVPGAIVWPHITVACNKVRLAIQPRFHVPASNSHPQGHAWQSNKLPSMLEQGGAVMTPIHPPVSLPCVIGGHSKGTA